MNEQEKLLEEAIQWIALMHSGCTTHEQIEAFEHWRSSDLQRERLCHQLEQQLNVFKSPAANNLKSSIVREVISTPSLTRRALLSKMLFIGCAITVGGVVYNESYWLGDLRTGTGERRTLTLEDGSKLTLDACTAVDISWKPEACYLHLHKGAIFVNLARNKPDNIFITTPLGRISASGPQLMVGHFDISRAVAIDAFLSVQTNSGATQRVMSGNKINFDANHIFEELPVDGSETAWTDGMLEVRNLRLGEVLASMRRYRKGFVRVSTKAAALRLSGLFRLDDTDQMLEAIALILPLKITRYSDYLVMLDVT